MTELMKRAIEIAEEAIIAKEDPIGCVFTDGQRIVAEARNTVNATRNPTRHAEINCIDTVVSYCKANNMDFRDYFPKITVYVTLEPCIMCTAALADLKIKEVIYGCANERNGGKTVLDVNKIYTNRATHNVNELSEHEARSRR